MARRDDERADVDDLFWNEGEPAEPWDAAGPGGGRMRSGGHEPWATDPQQNMDAADPGDSWTQFFHEPIREPYGGAEGAGEAVPYGGRRFEYGRDTSAAREYGQLYGRDQRGFGHRRNTYYVADNATPWWEVGQREEEPPVSFAGVGPRNYQRSDERIEEEVVQRLADADWVDASEVEVEVSDGVVTLEGTVESRAARRAAEDLVAEVTGVADVINRLRSLGRSRPNEARAPVA
jgi:hypothetical protein